MTSTSYESSASPTCATTRRGASRWPSRSSAGWTTATLPLLAASAARIGFHAAGRRAVRARGRGLALLRDRATRQLDRARDGLTDEWRRVVPRRPARARGGVRRQGRRGVRRSTQFRAAVALADPFGAYFALEPRLDLAQELLATRRPGRGPGAPGRLLDAPRTSMGAHGLEQRAVRLATRTRVPLPESAARRDR